MVREIARNVDEAAHAEPDVEPIVADVHPSISSPDIRGCSAEKSHFPQQVKLLQIPSGIRGTDVVGADARRLPRARYDVRLEENGSQLIEEGDPDLTRWVAADRT
ncbi:hypothetical protein [Paracoccus jeotgali]|uniref:hypothetical protein n=1 Tax=Paracoccus jeotgali TaxID=2065379 RepID=UPI0028AE73D0|nr:hypothetical protein [Paracoccus jeotgali]